MRKLIFLIFAFCCCANAADRAATEQTANGASLKEAYELQERCGKQAKEYFERYPKQSVQFIDADYDYENHYNQKLNKCFILISFRRFGKSYVRMYTLKDVNENKLYAFLNVDVDGVQSCEILVNNCKSEDEWKAFTRPYMEE